MEEEPDFMDDMDMGEEEESDEVRVSHTNSVVFFQMILWRFRIVVCFSDDQLG